MAEETIPNLMTKLERGIYKYPNYNELLFGRNPKLSYL